MNKNIFAVITSIACIMTFIAGSAEAAGVVDRIKGAAQRMGADGNGAVLMKGSRVSSGDKIFTGAGSRLEIKFDDESILNLGSRAEIVIDEMVYNAANPVNAEQALKIVVGVFRYTSGAIGKAQANNVALTTSVATIGIRGTRFLGGELTVGMPPGVPHYGFQIEEGAIEVLAPQGSVVLDEPGEGTFIPMDASRPPTPVRQWTPAEAQEAIDALAF